jgi:RecJ-like exonuclease
MSDLDTSIEQKTEAVQGGAPVLDRGVTMTAWDLRQLLDAAEEADYVCDDCGATTPAPEECEECEGYGTYRCECKCGDRHDGETCDKCDGYGKFNLKCVCGEEKAPIRLRIGPALLDVEEVRTKIYQAHHRDKVYIAWNVEDGKLYGALLVNGSFHKLRAKVAH